MTNCCNCESYLEGIHAGEISSDEEYGYESPFKQAGQNGEEQEDDKKEGEGEGEVVIKYLYIA